MIANPKGENGDFAGYIETVKLLPWKILAGFMGNELADIRYECSFHSVQTHWNNAKHPGANPASGDHRFRYHGRQYGDRPPPLPLAQMTIKWAFAYNLEYWPRRQRKIHQRNRQNSVAVM